MAKHTAGPWRVQLTDGYPQIRPEAEPAYCVGIAPANIGMPHEETIANARLIAASPDLLNAARRILSWYPDSVIAGASESSDQGWQDLTALAAAVAKATDQEATHA